MGFFPGAGGSAQDSSWDVPQHLAPATPPGCVEVWVDPTQTPRMVSPPLLQPAPLRKGHVFLFFLEKAKTKT